MYGAGARRANTPASRAEDMGKVFRCGSNFKETQPPGGASESVVDANMENEKSDKGDEGRSGRLRKFGIWTVVLVLVAYVCGYAMRTTVTKKDDRVAADLVSVVTADHPIPESVSLPGQPGMFCSPSVTFMLLARYETCQIYGVRARRDQDAIIQTLDRFEHTSEPTLRLCVKFYEKENWTRRKDVAGRTKGERGPETLMREVWIPG